MKKGPRKNEYEGLMPAEAFMKSCKKNLINLTFEEVLPYLRDGKKVRRRSWQTALGLNDYVLVMRPCYKDLIIQHGSSFTQTWIPNGDILADDWEVVQED